MTMANASSRSQKRSLVSRVLLSSVGDLLHGRITPRDPSAKPVEAAQLPAPLATMVREVTRQTRLWPSEKAAVANELTAHFVDGLAAGATVEELRGSFGDTRHTARLIRRAKVRNRPLIARLPMQFMRFFAALSGSMVILYILLAIWIGMGSPDMSRNYWHEYNTSVLAIPEDERAWPLYRKGYLALRGEGGELLRGNLTTRRDDWEEVVALLQENRPAIALFREATRREHLGRVHSPAFDVDLEAQIRRFWGGPGGPLPDADISSIEDNPPLIGFNGSHLVALRTASKLLWWDTLLALQDGDGERAIENITASLRITRQLDEVEHANLISQLQLIACAAGAFECVHVAILEYADTLDNRQWQELAHRIASVRGGGRITLDFQNERDMFYDMLQRLYTEAGYPAPTFGPRIMSVSSGLTDDSKRDRLYGPLTAPLAATVVADREAMRAKYDEIMTSYESAAAKPLWKREDDRATAMILAIQDDSLMRWRYLPITILMPALNRAAHLAEIATQERDVTYVAIALELYHREHGRWPTALSDLVPRFLPAVPPDRFDGRPLKYTIAEGQPVLYSVGVDRDDDGGRLIAPQRYVGNSRYKRNRAAREWVEPTTIRRLRTTDQGKRYDGDWILWPPIRDNASQHKPK